MVRFIYIGCCIGKVHMYIQDVSFVRFIYIQGVALVRFIYIGWCIGKVHIYRVIH